MSPARKISNHVLYLNHLLYKGDNLDKLEDVSITTR